LGDVLQPQAWFPLRLDQGLHSVATLQIRSKSKKLAIARRDGDIAGIEFRLRLRLGPL